MSIVIGLKQKMKEGVQDFHYFYENKFRLKSSATVDEFSRTHKRVISQYDGIAAFMCPICNNVEYYEIHESEKFTVKCDTIGNTIELYKPDHYKIKCEHCDILIDGIMLDPNIAYAISILNKKGYITHSCCEGHKHREDRKIEYTDSYIIFSLDANDIFSMYQRQCIPGNYYGIKCEYLEKTIWKGNTVDFVRNMMFDSLNTLPLGWNIDINTIKNYSEVYPVQSGKGIVKNFIKISAEYINKRENMRNIFDITKWAMSLPNIIDDILLKYKINDKMFVGIG